MIKIDFLISNGNHIGFIAKGHASFAKHGKDIVCAAVSVLTQNTANALEYFIGANNLKVEIADGDLTVCLISALDEKAKHAAEVLMQALYLGLTDLKDTYPKHLEVGKQEVD